MLLECDVIWMWIGETANVTDYWSVMLLLGCGGVKKIGCEVTGL
jgi:hypothetical protein